MEEIPMRKSVTLVLDGGVVDGDQVFKRYTYSGVLMTATADAVQSAAAALAGLYAEAALAEVQTSLVSSIN